MGFSLTPSNVGFYCDCKFTLKVKPNFLEKNIYPFFSATLAVYEILDWDWGFG